MSEFRKYINEDSDHKKGFDKEFQNFINWFGGIIGDAEEAVEEFDDDVRLKRDTKKLNKLSADFTKLAREASKTISNMEF